MAFSRILEQILDSRGFSPEFLKPKYEDLSNPLELPDMKKAVERIIAAKKHQEKILIYGDYDVDGVTATVIMYEALRLMGITGVETMLPDRFIDGYGMSKRLVKRAKTEGIDLVITVDCGSNNCEIVDELVNNKTEVIVTDHHEIADKIPEKAVAVINPKREDCPKSKLDSDSNNNNQKLNFRELSGAGVAFMLAKALADLGEIPSGQEKWLLDLAMIGTICDSMVLIGDNRIICKYGMIVLEKTRRPGLIELIRSAGTKKINTEAITFQLGPRLNASGRMETAERSLDLLLTDSKVEASGVAEELNRLNSERRRQQNAAITEVEQSGIDKAPVIVVSGKWNEGIVGIIAGRLTEKYKRPSIVLTEVNGALKGSGRSFGEFNLALALSECQSLLITGGGHAAACGLSLEKNNFDEFKTKINEYYQGLGLKNQERFLKKQEDAETDEVSEINLDLIDEMKQLEPFGEGNPEPVILLKDMLVLNVDKIGAEGKHLRMLIRDKNNKSLKLIAFGAPEKWLNLHENARINVWITAMENEWNGIRSAEGRILDLKYCD